MIQILFIKACLLYTYHDSPKYYTPQIFKCSSISDMIRARLDVIIFVLNNQGYTVERWIHGMKAEYNDIMPWRYLQTAEYFGAASVQDDTYPIFTERASSWRELSQVLQSPQVVRGKGLTIVELLLEESDAPLSLQKIAAAAASRFCT